MRELLWILSAYTGPLLMIGAAIAFYLAGRTGDDALSHGGRSSALRHATGYWMPMAIVALVATVMDQPAIAVGVIFATSVAALSLHLGVVAVSMDEPELAPPPPAARAWPFLLPVAVLALVAGFSGRITHTHAALFVVQGAMIVMVWRDRVALAEAADTAGSAPDETPAPRGGISLIRGVELLLAIALGIVGAWAAVRGAERMSLETRIMSHGLIAATTIGPLLILPMIGGGSALIRRGRTQVALSASVIVPLLNLCLLLPLVVVVWETRPIVTHYIAQFAEPVAQASTSTQPIAAPTTAPALAPSMSYPMTVWRVDTVMLIVLALFILPVGLRRWPLGRREGALLIVGYAVYLVLTTVLGRRW